MKKETIVKRLSKSSVNKTTIAYKLLKAWLESDDNHLIRPCHTSGRGRFCKNLDYTRELESLLAELRVRYLVGNDSPRGGKTGNYIKILL